MKTKNCGVQTYDVLQIADANGEWNDYVTVSMESDIPQVLNMVRSHDHYRIVGKGLRSHFTVTRATLNTRR